MCVFQLVKKKSFGLNASFSVETFLIKSKDSIQHDAGAIHKPTREASGIPFCALLLGYHDQWQLEDLAQTSSVPGLEKRFNLKLPTPGRVPEA